MVKRVRKREARTVYRHQGYGAWSEADATAEVEGQAGSISSAGGGGGSKRKRNGGAKGLRGTSWGGDRAFTLADDVGRGKVGEGKWRT